jgi:hypothetical protein
LTGFCRISTLFGGIKPVWRTIPPRLHKHLLEQPFLEGLGVGVQGVALSRALPFAAIVCTFGAWEFNANGAPIFSANGAAYRSPRQRPGFTKPRDLSPEGAA